MVTLTPYKPRERSNDPMHPNWRLKRQFSTKTSRCCLNLTSLSYSDITGNCYRFKMQHFYFGRKEGELEDVVTRLYERTCKMGRIQSPQNVHTGTGLLVRYVESIASSTVYNNCVSSKILLLYYRAMLCIARTMLS